MAAVSDDHEVQSSVLHVTTRYVLTQTCAPDLPATLPLLYFLSSQHGVLEAEGRGWSGQAETAATHRGGRGGEPPRVRRAPKPVAAVGKRESYHVKLPREGNKGNLLRRQPQPNHGGAACTGGGRGDESPPFWFLRAKWSHTAVQRVPTFNPTKP